MSGSRLRAPLGWAAVAAALGLHCNVELEVLAPPGGAGGSEVAGEGGAGGGASGCPGGCGPLPACAMADGTTCVRQAGEPCDGDHRCCTGVCAPEPDGGSRCAQLSGCLQRCEVCDEAADCCSGVCEADGSGAMRCAPPPTPGCLAEGELCQSSSSCCDHASGASCIKLDLPYDRRRCHVARP